MKLVRKVWLILYVRIDMEKYKSINVGITFITYYSSKNNLHTIGNIAVVS